jgi:hypothetical protein
MKLQFQILYREFLFRLVDLELLSADAQGDMRALLGQFAAFLIVVSLVFGGVALVFMGNTMPPPMRLVALLTIEHLIIATTMLVVGLFAVLSWDSTFPDRRDVLVLAPLPVRARTMFFAKVAASATGLCLAVTVLNALSGLLWPFAIADGAPSLIRSFAAYWITLFAAGAFVYCSVLCVQGLSAQLLSRARFLRVSAFLQIAALCLFVSVYLLEPPVTSLNVWLPSYWFLGLLQQLNGTMRPALNTLPGRAWAGLAVVVCGATVSFFLSWFRTLRKIVEEPDIVAGSRGSVWLPPFGNSVETAIVQFSIRTLMRSRQHRLILAFYLGIALALVILFGKSPDDRPQILLTSTVIVLGFWMVGTRVVFAMPIDLRANWIFRITPIRGSAQCLRASRRSLLVLALVPVWAGTAILLLSVWPWRRAASHLIILGIFGLILADLCLHNFRKIPFTCSYLPGRSNIHVTLMFCVFLMIDITAAGIEWELRGLGDARHFALMVGILCLAAILVRRQTAVEKWDDGPPVFEKVLPSSVITLGLPRDGGLPE